MKTKFYSVALLASAALIAQAKADGHPGGGGGGVAHSAPAHVAAPAFHSAPRGSFGGGRFMAPGQRFSSVGLRPTSAGTFRPHYVNSNGGMPVGTRQFTPRNINRGDRIVRFPNAGNHAIADPTNGRTGTIQNPNGRDRLAQFGNNPRLAQREAGAGQLRNGTNLPSNWRNHVVAQHSGNWHHDWDRGRDHNWHGHHCRFINGSWVIFDSGFYPWWPYAYPYDYYASDDYAPGYYDPYVYENAGADYYGQGAYDSSAQYADSTVAAAQEQLARQGYYRGQIDGAFGPETRRAIMRYQSGHGLRVTGILNTDTLHALGVPRVASN